MFDVVETWIAVLKAGGNSDGRLTATMSKQHGGTRRRQRHAVAAGRHAVSRFAVHRRRPAGPVGGDGGRQRQRLGLQLRDAEQPDHPALWNAYRELPPGMKTGDQISPPGGYVGGGLQMQTDLAVGPAGDVWVMNNWEDINSCFGTPDETLSTRCGGQGVVVFFGMAKPVRAPQIGPARAPDPSQPFGDMLARMSSSPEADPSVGWPKKPPATWVVAFGLATLAAVIVGLSVLSQMTPNSGSAVDVLGPVICMAYAAFTWIVAFPSAWLLIHLIRRVRRPRSP